MQPQHKMSVSASSARLLRRALMPVWDLLERPDVTEVVINEVDRIFFESNGRLQRADVRFESDESLEVVCNLLTHHAGRVPGKWDFEIDTTIVGPPAIRAHANLGSISARGPVITLRKLSRANITLSDLSGPLATITQAACVYLGEMINRRRNILICGGTGTGKTTILQCLSELIPADERLVVIEDTPELAFSHDNIVSLVARRADDYGEGEVTVRDLFRSSLRLRPDRIVIGEVRGAEAFDLVQALASGHAGSLCTLHAENTHLALGRLQALAMMSDVPQLPQVLQQQIGEVIHAVVEIQRSTEGRRRVSAISEVGGCSGGDWTVMPIFARRLLPGGTETVLERV